jgi:hypothetical protein
MQSVGGFSDGEGGATIRPCAASCSSCPSVISVTPPDVEYGGVGGGEENTVDEEYDVQMDVEVKEGAASASCLESLCCEIDLVSDRTLINCGIDDGRNGSTVKDRHTTLRHRVLYLTWAGGVFITIGAFASRL